MARILVVDDDRTTRHLLGVQLSSAGHEVEAAADGPAALKALAKRPVDLVLLDVWMPGMDGLSLLPQLHKLPAPPRVVVMTADDTPGTLLRAVREQASRFVTKPIEPAALLDLINSVLATPPPTRSIEVLSSRPDWIELLVPCERAAAERIHEFMARLDADLPQAVRDQVGQAFRELLMNAVEWGGGLDPTQTVRISYLRARRMLLYRIADPGKGFSFEGLSHAAVGNPEGEPFQHMNVREERGLRPGGFGILMTRSIVDELLYNEAQNEVVFVKYLD